MIAVDTSALMAIALGEPRSEACIDVLEAESDLLISAGTVAEALIVAGRRNLTGEMNILLEQLGFTIVPVTAAVSRRIAEAYARWGRGVHPAGLNFGDCFAYALARENDCALLYVGDDFARTDLPKASP
ncbi:MAG TPA: type II toxin-antitoxin system VapC family toxin [Caulobacteraceae bacterium]|jgi:ribonuclease VapC